MKKRKPQKYKDTILLVLDKFPKIYAFIKSLKRGERAKFARDAITEKMERLGL